MLGRLKRKVINTYYKAQINYIAISLKFHIQMDLLKEQLMKTNIYI